ncbi:ABC transporter ATP-binding protein [Candidatus Kaiserbacteria bacterium]|nr:ABC transporter ATP-binding protein [Candidatus Kaiserbacteria bacterium]
MNALQVKNLVKEFGGVRAVDGLSVDFERGKITGVVGPNGSGKTTLTNLLTGMHAIDGGTVVVGGENEHGHIRSYEVFGLGITRTFQNVRLFEQMTVLDNILVVGTARSVWGSLFERHTAFHEHEARAVLERVGLWEKRYAYANTLSYGQRKLLEIARALATKADIILFDEPYAGLFPEMVKLVSDIMKELRAGEKTIILIEHDMALIRELCDRVIVMDAGKLLAEGEPEAVLKDGKVIEAYLGV